MQRLEHLVECRSFDRLEIIASAGDSPRAELSRVAAAAASAGMASEELRTVPPTDLAANVALLQQLYHSMFVDASMDVAPGLTGWKVQLVAMAALSTVVKVAEAWFVAPSVYEPDTFTTGAPQFSRSAIVPYRLDPVHSIYDANQMVTLRLDANGPRRDS